MLDQQQSKGEPPVEVLRFDRARLLSLITDSLGKGNLGQILSRSLRSINSPGDFIVAAGSIFLATSNKPAFKELSNYCGTILNEVVSFNFKKPDSSKEDLFTAYQAAMYLLAESVNRGDISDQLKISCIEFTQRLDKLGLERQSEASKRVSLLKSDNLLGHLATIAPLIRVLDLVTNIRELLREEPDAKLLPVANFILEYSQQRKTALETPDAIAIESLNDSLDDEVADLRCAAIELHCTSGQNEVARSMLGQLNEASYICYGAALGNIDGTDPSISAQAIMPRTNTVLKYVNSEITQYGQVGDMHRGYLDSLIGSYLTNILAFSPDRFEDCLKLIDNFSISHFDYKDEVTALWLAAYRRGLPEAKTYLDLLGLGIVAHKENTEKFDSEMNDFDAGIQSIIDIIADTRIPATAALGALAELYKVIQVSQILTEEVEKKFLFANFILTERSIRNEDPEIARVHYNRINSGLDSCAVDSDLIVGHVRIITVAQECGIDPEGEAKIQKLLAQFESTYSSILNFKNDATVTLRNALGEDIIEHPNSFLGKILKLYLHGGAYELTLAETCIRLASVLPATMFETSQSLLKRGCIFIDRCENEGLTTNSESLHRVTNKTRLEAIQASCNLLSQR